jgi:hypothetical protein
MEHPEADSSGMTGSANCGIVFTGRGDSCGVKCIEAEKNFIAIKKLKKIL